MVDHLPGMNSGFKLQNQKKETVKEEELEEYWGMEEELWGSPGGGEIKDRKKQNPHRLDLAMVGPHQDTCRIWLHWEVAPHRYLVHACMGVSDCVHAGVHAQEHAWR